MSQNSGIVYRVLYRSPLRTQRLRTFIVFYPTNHLIGEIVGPLSNSSSSTARRSSRAAHARPSSQSLPRVPATRVPDVSPPNTGEAGPAACCVLRSNFCGLQVLPESCASALNSSSPVFALPTDVESDPLCVRRTASELAAKSCLSWCSLNCLSARTCAVSRCSALASCAACFSARSLASSAALRLCNHRRKTSVSSHHQYVLCIDSARDKTWDQSRHQLWSQKMNRRQASTQATYC